MENTREILEITVRNLQVIAGEIPMRYKGSIFDPLMQQVQNLQRCIDAERKEQDQKTAECIVNVCEGDEK